MISRRLARTDNARTLALKTCSDKAFATPPGEWLITPAQQNTLQGKLSPWRNARNEAAGALQKQTKATATCATRLSDTVTIISHFIQVLNMAITRKVLDPSVRTFFKLPVSDATVPEIYTIPDALLWAENIADGEAARTAAGNPPIAWPSAAEVTATAALLNSAHIEQTTCKTFYDQMQEAIDTQRPGVDAHLKDLWDTIEYNLRHETDHASLRRKAREWGVVYEGDTEVEEEEQDPANPVNPAPPTP